jgi:hypothetical protein
MTTGHSRHGTSAGSVLPVPDAEPTAAAPAPVPPPATQRGFYGLAVRLDQAAQRATHAGRTEDARVYLAIQSRLAEIANDLPGAIQASIHDEDECLKTALSFLHNTI